MQKKFFANHAKSSAALVSLGVHAVIIVIAFSFVAVTVIQKNDQVFESKKISRPKMQLKKLQVPVNIKKKKMPKPKLRKRIVVKPKLDRQLPDIKMPEITGVKGGMGNAAGTGLGGGASIGFSMPEFNLFGIRSRGEKVVFLLDTQREMLVDEVGGIPAYTIIKQELIGLVEKLPPTTLFNVIVFEFNDAAAFSEEMAIANKETVARLKTWLEPLNADKQRIGFDTLPSPRHPVEFEPMPPIYNTQKGWPGGLSYALQKKADSIYWLGSHDHGLDDMHTVLWEQCKRGKPLQYPNGRMPNGGGGHDIEGYGVEKWNKLVAKARNMHEEENARRLKKGEPVRVLKNSSDLEVVITYLPNAPRPKALEQLEFHRYTVDDVVGYINAMTKKYNGQQRRKSGLTRSKMSFNTIHFVPVDEESKILRTLDKVPKEMNGKYLQLRGLEAIKSSTANN